MKQGRIFFVCGIDTGIGKTVATGLLARALAEQGRKVVTAKLVQTGCRGVSEDILVHRQLMGIDLLPCDLDGTTCPYVFSVPCSPHLAARLEGKEIAVERLRHSAEQLGERFEVVLIEGAGGLLVPLRDDLTTLDYLAEQRYPVVLVSSSRLGSINHTLAAFELLASRRLEIALVLYNLYGNDDPRIVADSRRIFRHYLDKQGSCAPIVDLETSRGYEPNCDLSAFAAALV